MGCVLTIVELGLGNMEVHYATLSASAVLKISTMNSFIFFNGKE